MGASWHRRAGPPVRHIDPNAALGRYLEVIRRAELAGSPPPPAALNGLGDAYFDLGDQALADEHHLQAAEGYAAQGLWDNAVACCRKVLRREPGHARAGLLLGRCYAAKGLRAEALDVLRNLADESAETGHRRDALAALEEVVRIEPYDARLRERLGRLLQEEGRSEEARSAYGAALELCLQNGDPAGAEHARTRLEALAGMAEAGVSPPRSRSPEEGVPDPGAADRVAARQAFADGRWTDAGLACRRLAADGRAGADDFAVWTEAARRAGRPAAVLEALEFVARWHLAGGRPKEAQRAAEEMILVDPRNETASALLEHAATLPAD